MTFISFVVREKSINFASGNKAQRIMKKSALILSLIIACIVNMNAGLFVHTRRDFEDEFPDHYPGRICFRDGTIKEFPAIRIWYTLDDEIWAWTNVEEFNKVTFNVNDVEWVEVWNAKAPDKKFRCIKYQNGLYTRTFIIIKEVNHFRIMSQYCYFSIDDSGKLKFHTYTVQTYNGQHYTTETKGIPFVYVINRLKDRISWGYGFLLEDGTVNLSKDIRSHVKSIVKGDKELQKKVSAIKDDWTMELLLDILSQYNPTK